MLSCSKYKGGRFSKTFVSKQTVSDTGCALQLVNKKKQIERFSKVDFRCSTSLNLLNGM